MQVREVSAKKVNFVLLRRIRPDHWISLLSFDFDTLRVESWDLRRQNFLRNCKWLQSNICCFKIKIELVFGHGKPARDFLQSMESTEQEQAVPSLIITLWNFSESIGVSFFNYMNKGQCEIVNQSIFIRGSNHLLKIFKYCLQENESAATSVQMVEEHRNH